MRIWKFNINIWVPRFPWDNGKPWQQGQQSQQKAGTEKGTKFLGQGMNDLLMLLSSCYHQAGPGAFKFKRRIHKFGFFFPF
jgi:hypothetical protein